MAVQTKRVFFSFLVLFLLNLIPLYSQEVDPNVAAKTLREQAAEVKDALLAEAGLSLLTEGNPELSHEDFKIREELRRRYFFNPLPPEFLLPSILPLCSGTIPLGSLCLVLNIRQAAFTGTHYIQEDKEVTQYGDNSDVTQSDSGVRHPG